MTSILTKQPKLNAPNICKLDNGLTIIAEQMPVDAVNLNVWINVGSAKESDEINGMAHFLEHMVFKGTPNLEIGEFEQLIEERGAVTNAATSQDYTHYYITTAPKDFAELAPLQLDVVLNPSLENEAFEREKLVVLEEIRRSEDSPRRRTFYRSMETCYETLPYRRPVLGPATVIESLRSQQMRDFHGAWYQPQSMTAAVVGNLPVEELVDIVTQAFDSHYSLGQEYQKNTTPSVNPEKPFNEIVRHEYTDESLQQSRLVMVWRVPGMKDIDETYALDVLAVILGQGKVSRLFRELREEKGLVNQIGVSNMTQTHQGVFYISAALPAENIEEVEQAISDQIKNIQVEPIATKDIDRIRTQVANRFIFANERPSDRANLYGYYYSQLQDLAPALNYSQHIQSVSARDLQKAAQKYLNPEAYGVVVMKPA
ncbi:insulinase family protein [Waterburya agarophytonicola K14]|uniref:Insulinase family protein n=1 Tax=Waterburya agarophytonicola KI4 TaxID=2874699 RepID=A0A964BV60_9CYAN|nr:pitrilysin family protein [Waterburya agarophytonicola]MCC0179018.1 insulinase family protein [Waterburya agarophytonicola KI4]